MASADPWLPRPCWVIIDRVSGHSAPATEAAGPLGWRGGSGVLGSGAAQPEGPSWGAPPPPCSRHQTDCLPALPPPWGQLLLCATSVGSEHRPPAPLGLKHASQDTTGRKASSRRPGAAVASRASRPRRGPSRPSASTEGSAEPRVSGWAEAPAVTPACNVCNSIRRMAASRAPGSPCTRQLHPQAPCSVGNSPPPHSSADGFLWFCSRHP